MRAGIRRIIVVACLILSTGCGKKEEPKTREYPVKIGEVIQKDTPHFIKGVGQLVPSIDVDIKAQVDGILTSVLFEDGEVVEEGDLLMTIDPRIYEAEVQEAQAQLEEDRARLRYALDFAKSYGLVVGEQYVSRLDYEQGIQNVEVYKAAVENDEAALKKAQVNLGYTQIRAPFKGYIGLRKYDPGNYVDSSANETLVTLHVVVPIEVSFSLPSQYVQEKRGQQKKQPMVFKTGLPL